MGEENANRLRLAVRLTASQPTIESTLPLYLVHMYVRNHASVPDECLRLKG